MTPLIAPKPIADFTADEYHTYVSEMYAMPAKRAASKTPGLAVTRTKAGKLSIRRTKARTFEYVTYAEIAELAKQNACPQADIWNVFKQRGFIITKTRMEAEEIYAKLKDIPWGTA